MFDMRRRAFIFTLGGAAAAWPLAARAQQRTEPLRVGFLGAASAAGYAARVEALRESLRDLGYTEGKNLIFETRWAENNYARLVGLATELVRLGSHVIVTHGAPGTQAAKQATATVPIVMAVSGDAVATKLVASLARPGGNVTGSSFFSPELNVKQDEFDELGMFSHAVLHRPASCFGRRIRSRLPRRQPRPPPLCSQGPSCEPVRRPFPCQTHTQGSNAHFRVSPRNRKS